MTKFEKYFSRVQFFTDCTSVLRGDLPIEDAASMFSNELGQDITVADIEVDYVRFGFAPEYVEECQGQNVWYTGAGKGKGSKKVWTVKR